MLGKRGTNMEHEATLQVGGGRGAGVPWGGQPWSACWGQAALTRC